MPFVPTSYPEVALFLALAVGAALFFGTGAALLRYYRTGLFPGEASHTPAGGDLDVGDPHEPGPAAGLADSDTGQEPRATRAQLRAAAVKCGLGAVMMVWALGTLIVQRGS